MKKAWRRLSPPSLADGALKSYTAHMRSGSWLTGRASGILEAHIAGLAGLPPEHVIVTDTCTNALAAAGRVCIQGPRDVIETLEKGVKVCPLTYSGTYSWAMHNHRWVDCDDDGWPVGSVDVGVDLWGRAFMAPGVSTPAILDAAHRFEPQRHGFWLTDKGSEHLMAVCYSFGPMKEVPGVRGGAVLFRNVEFAAAARGFLNNGISNGVPSGPGRKGLIANAEAAFLMKQMKKRTEWYRLRQQVLTGYSLYFPQASPVATLMTRPGEASGHLCVLKFGSQGLRDLVRDRLRNCSVETSVHYPVPEDAPEGCKKLAARILSIPCHPGMRRYDVHKVASRIISI